MKQIIVKESNYCNGNESTYYVTFPFNPTWSYTIRTSEEGMHYVLKIWKEAGYEIIEEPIAVH